MLFLDPKIGTRLYAPQSRTTKRLRWALCGILIAVTLVAIVAASQAAPPSSPPRPISTTTTIVDWIPDTGDWATPIGDMYKFRCPPGGKFLISADTLPNSNQTGQADIDLLARVLDANGKLLAEGDDQVKCTYEPVCGFHCPQLWGECGSGPHYLTIQDFGAATVFGHSPCGAGGGYRAKMGVTDAAGNSVDPRPTIAIPPRWLVGLAARFPWKLFMDDASLPNPFLPRGIADSPAAAAAVPYPPKGN